MMPTDGRLKVRKPYAHSSFFYIPSTLFDSAQPRRSGESIRSGTVSHSFNIITKWKPVHYLERNLSVASSTSLNPFWLSKPGTAFPRTGKPGLAIPLGDGLNRVHPVGESGDAERIALKPLSPYTAQPEVIPLLSGTSLISAADVVPEAKDDSIETLINSSTVYVRDFPLNPGRITANYPLQMTCLSCDKKVTTNVVYETGAQTFICGVLLFLSPFILCSWLPFLTKFAKDCAHCCPSCGNLMGKYKRIRIL